MLLIAGRVLFIFQKFALKLVQERSLMHLSLCVDVERWVEAIISLLYSIYTAKSQLKHSLFVSSVRSETE